MTTDILERLANSSPNEGSHDLHCRCLDAAAEISRMQAEIKQLKTAMKEPCVRSYWCTEDKSYESIGDYFDNEQPEVGETFELTPCKSFPACTFVCIQNGDSLEYEQLTGKVKA